MRLTSACGMLVDWGATVGSAGARVGAPGGGAGGKVGVPGGAAGCKVALGTADG